MKKFLYSALIGVTALTIVGGSVALAQGIGFGPGPNQANEIKAQLLGMTVDELTTQLETKTYAELLDEQGITHTQLQETMQAEHQARAEEHMQEMVNNGYMTQEEMDQHLEDIANGVRPEKDEGFGMMGGHRHGPMNDKNGDGVCDYMDASVDNTSNN